MTMTSDDGLTLIRSHSNATNELVKAKYMRTGACPYTGNCCRFYAVFFGVGVGGWQLHILALPYQMVGASSPTENSGSAPINFWYVSCVLLVQWLITEQVLLSLKSLERREAKVLNRDQRTIISLNHAMVFCGCLCCYTCLTVYSFATK